MIRWRQRRKIIFILSACFLVIVSLRYLTRDEIAKNAPKYSRDFVLQQEPQTRPTQNRRILAKHRIQTSAKKHRSSLHIFKSPVKNSLVDGWVGHVASFKTLQGNITMFTYDPKIDMISSYVRDYGTWEENFLVDIANVFKTRSQFPEGNFNNKDVVFLDLGCNIGVYTLYMAKLGVRVVAVDPVKRSLELLHQSLHRNNLTNRVNLVHNAVSDTRNNVSVRIPRENKGGAHIAAIKDQPGVSENVEIVETITLEDLVNNKDKNNNNNNGDDALHQTRSLIRENDKIFMKIDIEGNEERALVGGQAFFQRVNVIGIFMEWMHHRYKTSGENIVNVLVKNGFLPYGSASMKNFLNPDRYNTWPENVFWMKR